MGTFHSKLRFAARSSLAPPAQSSSAAARSTRAQHSSAKRKHCSSHVGARHQQRSAKRSNTPALPWTHRAYHAHQPATPRLTPEARPAHRRCSAKHLRSSAKTPATQREAPTPQRKHQHRNGHWGAKRQHLLLQTLANANLFLCTASQADQHKLEMHASNNSAQMWQAAFNGR